MGQYLIDDQSLQKFDIDTYFWLNLFTLLGLYVYDNDHPLLKNYFRNTSVNPAKINFDNSSDFFIIIKHLIEQNKIKKDVANKLTRLFAKIKTKSLKVFDEDVFRKEIFNKIKLTQIKCDILFKPVIKKYKKGEINIIDTIKDCYVVLKRKFKDSELIPLIRKIYKDKLPEDSTDETQEQQEKEKSDIKIKILHSKDIYGKDKIEEYKLQFLKTKKDTDLFKYLFYLDKKDIVSELNKFDLKFSYFSDNVYVLNKVFQNEFAKLNLQHFFSNFFSVCTSYTLRSVFVFSTIIMPMFFNKKIFETWELLATKFDGKEPILSLRQIRYLGRTYLYLKDFFSLSFIKPKDIKNFKEVFFTLLKNPSLLSNKVKLNEKSEMFESKDINLNFKNAILLFLLEFINDENLIINQEDLYNFIKNDDKQNAKFILNKLLPFVKEITSKDDLYNFIKNEIKDENLNKIIDLKTQLNVVDIYENEELFKDFLQYFKNVMRKDINAIVQIKQIMKHSLYQLLVNKQISINDLFVKSKKFKELFIKNFNNLTFSNFIYKLISYEDNFEQSFIKVFNLSDNNTEFWNFIKEKLKNDKFDVMMPILSQNSINFLFENNLTLKEIIIQLTLNTILEMHEFDYKYLCEIIDAIYKYDDWNGVVSFLDKLHNMSSDKLIIKYIMESLLSVYLKNEEITYKIIDYIIDKKLNLGDFSVYERKSLYRTLIDKLRNLFFLEVLNNEEILKSLVKLVKYDNIEKWDVTIQMQFVRWFTYIETFKKYKHLYEKTGLKKVFEKIFPYIYNFIKEDMLINQVDESMINYFVYIDKYDKIFLLFKDKILKGEAYSFKRIIDLTKDVNLITNQQKIQSYLNYLSSKSSNDIALDLNGYEIKKLFNERINKDLQKEILKNYSKFIKIFEQHTNKTKLKRRFNILITPFIENLIVENDYNVLDEIINESKEIKNKILNTIKKKAIILHLYNEFIKKDYPIKPLVKLDKQSFLELLKYNNIDTNIIKTKGRIKNIKDYINKVNTELNKILQNLQLKIEKVEHTKETLQQKTIELNKYLSKNWNHGNIAAEILEEYDVHLPDEAYQEFKKQYPDTVMYPVFHGTGSVAASFILRTGFAVVDGKFIKAGRMLGNGIYFTNVLDKSLQYVGDKSFTRRHGTIGYIFEMEACLGKKGQHYQSAGLGGDYIKSPEWCVFYPGNQLKIKKAYKVKLVSRKYIESLMKKETKKNES